jgi:hypothetical protein
MATAAETKTSKTPTILPPDDARALFDRQARNLVGMSGEEFLRRWDAGEYQGRNLDEDQETRKIAHLVLLIPFGRAR